MGENLIDSIQLNVTSKATLTGLDQSLKKLDVLSARLTQIQAQISGFSLGPSLGKSKKEIEDILKGGLSKDYSVKTVAQMLGVPPNMMAQFDSFLGQWKAKNAELAKTRLHTASLIGEIGRAHV